MLFFPFCIFFLCLLCSCQSSVYFLSFFIFIRIFEVRYFITAFDIAIAAIMAERSHLFPFRTQKLSFLTPKVLSGTPLGRIGHCRFSFFESLSEVAWIAILFFISRTLTSSLFYSFFILCLSFFNVWVFCLSFLTLSPLSAIIFNVSGTRAKRVWQNREKRFYEQALERTGSGKLV